MKLGNDIYRKISIRRKAENNSSYEINQDINSEKETLNSLEDNMIIVNSIWNVDYDFLIHSHRKFIGKFIIIGKKLVRKLLKWYVRDTGIEQNKFNSYSVKVMNGIWDYINISNSKNVELNKKYDYLNEKISELIIENEKLKNNMIELSNNNDKLESTIVDLNKKIESNQKLYRNSNEKIDYIEKLVDENLSHINYRFTEYNENISYLKYRLKTIIENRNYLSSSMVNNIKTDKEETKPSDFMDNEIDYFDFENKFRGLENEITQKQEIYLPYFKDCKKVVLDIGSGRGEFLSMLKKNNILSKGVDIYPEFVDYCKYKNLDVVLDDAILFLQKLEDDSLGGIFIGQVVEHLETSYLIKLLSLCKDKLCVGGKIIAETQNPKTLGVLGEAFYIDPSHIKPIHPLQLKYLVESSGFKNIETIYLNEFEEKIPYPIGVINSEEVNNSIDRLNNLLYGPRDYSIVGEK